MNQSREAAVKRAAAARNHEAEFGKQAASSIDERSAFFLPPFAHPVPGEAGLLLDTLYRHEAHVGLANSRADGFGIVAVVLARAALAKRLYEFGGHDLRRQTEPVHHPCPLVRAATSFHPDHAALGQLDEPRTEILPA